MRRPALLLSLLTLAGCAGTLYSSSKATVTGTPDDTFTCVQEQLKQLGYQRRNYDTQERWYVGQKVDPAARVADVRFRQRFERLDTRVRPDASGGTSIEIKAQTIDQYGDQQGLTETERTASTQVKLDARTVVEACGK